MFEKLQIGEKIHDAPRQPQTCSHPIYTRTLTRVCQAIRIFSLCFFHDNVITTTIGGKSFNIANESDKIVTGSAKRGLIADPNCTHLESHYLTFELSITFKFHLLLTLSSVHIYKKKDDKYWIKALIRWQDDQILHNTQLYWWQMHHVI